MFIQLSRLKYLEDCLYVVEFSMISFSSIKAVHSKSQDQPASPSSSGSPSPPGNSVLRSVHQFG